MAGETHALPGPGGLSRLGIIGAAATGLEGVDADDLLARSAEAGRAGIGAFEVDVARRPLRHEVVLLGGGLRKSATTGIGGLSLGGGPGACWLTGPRGPV